MLCGLGLGRKYNLIKREFMLPIDDAVWELLREDAPEQIRWIRRTSRRNTVQFVVSLDSVHAAQAAINNREDMGFTLEIYDGELEITSNRNMHIQVSLPLCDPELTQKAWQFIHHNSS